MNPPRPSPPPATPPDRDEDDAREFAEFAQGQNPLDLEAATWLARRRQGLDADGEAEFHAWLATDPAHAEAWRDMEATFGKIRRLPDDTVAALKAGLDVQHRPDRQTAPHTAPAQAPGPAPEPNRAARAPTRPACRASPRRRAWLLEIGRLLPRAAITATVFALFGGGWLGWEHWQRQPTFSHSYATARGQQLTVALPDGSRLQLDTATRADVRLYRDRREVRLADGQVMFAVQADPAQPFHVQAGDLRVTVVGTRFAVRHTGTGLDPGATRVMVEEGRVRVVRLDSTQGATLIEARRGIELGAGQTVVAAADGTLGPLASVPPGSVAPWRDGRVSFDNTPLDQALAEFERYGRTGLVIRDPGVAALRIGGSFSIQQFGAFRQVLPQLLPVRLERRGDVIEIVATP